MTMHETGVRVRTALVEMFPERDIRVYENKAKTLLGVSFKVGETRIAAYTPTSLDYRALPYQTWLHRFSEIIREREACPKSSTQQSPSHADTLSANG